MRAVTPNPAPVEQTFRMDDNLDMYMENHVALVERTEDLAEAFYDAGMFTFYSLS